MSEPRPVTPLSILVDRLSSLITRAERFDDSFRTELRQVFQLASGLDPYLEQWTTPESDALRELSVLTRAHDWGTGSGLEQEMLSGHVEGQLLKMLVRATRATKVLEVGMFTGYSALAMAEALPPGGTVTACEIDAEVAALAGKHFAQSPAGSRIDVRVGPAADTLRELAAAGERFGLVFIDADKAGYLGYLDAVLGGDLLEAHGLICVDNTLMQGQPWTSGPRGDNGRAIAEFNRAVAADARVEQVIVPLRDGLTIISRAEAPCTAPS